MDSKRRAEMCDGDAHAHEPKLSVTEGVSCPVGKRPAEAECYSLLQIDYKLQTAGRGG